MKYELYARVLGSNAKSMIDDKSVSHEDAITRAIAYGNTWMKTHHKPGKYGSYWHGENYTVYSEYTVDSKMGRLPTHRTWLIVSIVEKYD